MLVAHRPAPTTAPLPRRWRIPLAPLALALSCLVLPATAGAEIVHYSETPSHTEPYAACPPASADRAQCLVIVDPTSPLTPQITAERAPPRSSASPASASQISCREVFPASEYEHCGSGADHGFSPQDLQSAYRLPSETAGSGQTVAIVDAYDDPHAQADLDVYRSTYDLPPCESGCFTKVNQTGGTTYPEASEGWGLEISLDLAMVSAACPKCHILLVEANSESRENLGIAEDEAATLGATEISNSYAFNEDEVGKTQLEKDSKYYSHPGIPITVASGDKSWDDSSPCLDEEKTDKCIDLSPNFPADLSTVVAVGGTNIEPQGESGRGWNETTWNHSGSGCTLYVAKPSWQADKGCKQRTDNDVAAVAEGVSIYDTYLITPGWQDANGTSVATPLTASAIALESSALRAEGVEGIYKHTAHWYDITAGTNYAVEGASCAPELYLCEAKIGYDGPTGVGTPNGEAAATPPSAWTEPASAVTTTTATLNGIVDPEANTETTYYFQYGSSTSYGRMAPTGGAKASGYTQPSRVAQAISGLKPSSRYHFRVVAKNAAGTTYGADQTFSTAPKLYVSKFGSKGSAEGEFGEPQFTATNSEGDVWVSDYANDRVEEFSPSGTFMKSCGKAGSGEVEFDGPTGVAINSSGQLYISDSGNNRVEVINQSCGYWASFGQGYLSDPMGLAFTSGGNFSRELVLVANSGDDDIEEFSTGRESVGEKYTQKHEGSYGAKGSGDGEFLSPTDVILAARENANTQLFYVVDSGNDRVQEFSVSGLYTIYGESLTYKFDEAFGSKGSEEGRFSDPTAIALDPSTGDLAVTDTGNDRVEEFLPTGTYIATFGSAGSGNSSFADPKGIAVTSNGTLDIADTGNNRVTVWGPSEAAAAEWFRTTTPNPTKTLDSYFWGVSCTAANTGCTAVGNYSTKEGAMREPFAERWSGTEWSLQTTPTPSGAKTTDLDGVSCTSLTACMAVGYYESSLGLIKALAESWNGAEWQIDSTPEPSGTLGSLLSRVSCSASNACSAVGWYENSSKVEVPWVLRWNGTTWSLQTAPAPSGAKASYPNGVSCASASACTMAGYYENSSGTDTAFAEVWNGTEWTMQSVPGPSGSKKTRVSGLSCSASTACTMVGEYENSSGVEVTLAERWNGTEWSVQSTPNPTGAKVSYLIGGVSCASSTACTAVGVFENSSSQYEPLAEHWNGSEWQLQSPPTGEKGEAWLTGGVSCVSSTFCAAVGNTGTTFAEIYG
jgi:hypothetical protein